jgi:AmiR/NasT family two-component response regulator
MTAQRLVQNFHRFRGLLLAGPDFSSDTLERSLKRLGVSFARVEQIEGAALDPDRDIVFLDADQPVNPAPLLCKDLPIAAAPLIGIVGVEAPSRLRLLAEAGATAFLRKPIASASVYSALFLGVNNHHRLRRAETRIALIERKRRGRRFLIKAIVALMQSRALSDDDAYAMLRRECMRRRMDLEEFCESLFAEGQTFPNAWPGETFDDPSLKRGEAYAQIGNNWTGVDDLGVTADGESSGSDQARRA